MPEENEDESIELVIESWLRDQFLDGVHAKFRNEFHSLGDVDIESAIATVIERMQSPPRGGAIRHPRGYLIVATRHRLRNALRRIIPDELPHDDDRRLAARPTQDERLFASELLDIARGLLSRWPNQTMATVTLAYIESIYYGEPVALEDLQQIALDNLGEEITRTNASTLLKRGRDRLADQLPPDYQPERGDL